MKINHLFNCFGLLALFGGGILAQVVPNPVPLKVFGQIASPATVSDTVNPSSVTPNLLEGRELFRPQSLAVDTSLDPPALYVADTANNRVLAWRNARGVIGAVNADLVLGQRDLISSVPQQLTESYASGLNGPTSVAVDKNGNVFVADAGNNRILRFPKPFARRDEGVTRHDADLVIGQNSLLGRNPNQSTAVNAAPAANTIRTSFSGSTYNVDLFFDRNGNLWFTDAGNHRILRYPAESVSGGGDLTGGVTANLVIAQGSFSTNQANPGRITVIGDRIDKRLIRFPSALTIDDSGNLYVADDLARVLVYRAGPDGLQNFDTEADRLMGILVLRPGEERPPFVNQVEFGFEFTSTTFVGGVRGLFTIQNRLHVVDTVYHRILRYVPLDEWPPEAERFSPAAEAVIGQANFNEGFVNRFQFAEPSARSLYAPIQAEFVPNPDHYSGGEVYIADSQNNRVVVYPNFLTVNLDPEAERMIGQHGFEFRSPNLIEGREFSISDLAFRSGNSIGRLVLPPQGVIDYSEGQARFYLADPDNNRVLAFSDYNRLKTGDQADFVIGQVDLYRGLVNSPLMGPETPTRTGLNGPSALALDQEGNLFIADSRNERVVMYRKPFDKWRNGEPMEADLVIGQPDFETRLRRESVTADRIFGPTSVTITESGRLVVADPLLNRVLVFDPPFQNGMSASKVFGQPDFTSASPGSGIDQLNLPVQIAADVDSRLYVAESGNNRVVIYGSIDDSSQPAAGAAAVRGIDLRSYRVSGSTFGNGTVTGVAVNRRNGRIWIADFRNNLALRFPDFISLQFQTTPAPDAAVVAFGPRSIVLDENDNPTVFDNANRATFNYPQLELRNWATGSPLIAPNLIATLRTPGVVLSRETVSNPDAPWPRSLADIEVSVNGILAPVRQVEGESMRIQIPRDIPPTGRAEYVVRRTSTGQVLANSALTMVGESPALIPLNAPGGGFVEALNANGSTNSDTNPARPGEEITLLLVGYGSIENAPEEGTSPGSAVPVTGSTRVFAGVESTVVSSTLDPQRPGVWRLKTRIPESQACAAQAPQVTVSVIYRDRLSRVGPDGTNTITNQVHCRRQ